MAIPGSGPISLSDIATIVYNSSSTRISLNDSDVRTLLGNSSGQISMSRAYNKPASGNTGTTYYTPGSYSWVVVPYKTLSANVAGGGGAGGGYCGGQVFFGCVNICNSGSGGPGGNTSFNGVVAYRGMGGLQCSGGVGAAGGNNQNTSRGGGGAGGLGNTNAMDTNCNQSSGSNGGAGGFARKTWTKAVDGPAYGNTINFTVGAGGTPGANSCRPQAGAPGGSGYVRIEWS